MNARGFTLVEIMIAVGMVGILGLVMAGSMQVFQKTLGRQSEIESLMGVRQQMLTCMDSRDSIYFAGTSLFNRDLLCITELADCKLFEGSTYPFKPMSGFFKDCHGYNADDPDQGFRRDGSICNEFSIDGNDRCPYKYEFRWTPVCPRGKRVCDQPLVKIQGTMLYVPANQNLPRPNLKPLDIVSTIDMRTRTRDRISLEARYAIGVNPGRCRVNGNDWTVRAFTEVLVDGGSHAIPQRTRPTDPFYAFLLGPGTYECKFSAPAYRVEAHRATLFAKETRKPKKAVIRGQSAFSPNFDSSFPNANPRVPSPTYVTTHSVGNGIFKLDDPALMTLEHFCEYSGGRNYELGQSAPTTGFSQFRSGEYLRLDCTKLR